MSRLTKGIKRISQIEYYDRIERDKDYDELKKKKTMGRVRMPTPRSTITKIILQQDPALDNRQVSDLLNIPIEVVMNARRYHKVTHKITPRDRGLKQKILDAGKTISTRELSEVLNCSRSYIKLVRRNNP